MSKKLFSFLAMAVGSLALYAAPPTDSPDDEGDTFTRLNPELSAATSYTVDESRRYPYIRYDLNHIDMNGDDWSELSSKLAQSRQDGIFTIVHIGDSHVQADGNTGTTRKLFQQQYGNAGRGLIIPFRLAGTNEPLDYTITSPSTFVRSKLMNLPWAVTPGFTGVGLKPEEYNFSVTLKVKAPCGYFTILADGSPEVVDVTSDGVPVDFTAEAVDGGVDVSLDEDCLELTVKMRGDDVVLYGFDLRNDSPGVLYHAIGNNGAAYASYNGLRSFSHSIANLGPDLVIISLGTNEAFGRLNNEAFKAQMASMVNQVRRESPDTKILLVTPSECQKSVYTTSRRGKGKRRRTKRTRSYQINANVARVRDLIIDYGRENNIPVYDFYAVAGGQGASAKWLNDKLLNTDRIHRTWQGYRLDGRLIYDALHEALTKNDNQHKSIRR